MPFQMPLTMLLPISAILLGRLLSPLTMELNSWVAAAAPFWASCVPQVTTFWAAWLR